jgi:hypothetical protein
MIAGNPFTSIPNGFTSYGLNKSVWDPVSIFCQCETTLMNSRERRHYSTNKCDFPDKWIINLPDAASSMRVKRLSRIRARDVEIFSHTSPSFFFISRTPFN